MSVTPPPVPPDVPPGLPTAQTPDDRTMGMLCHLLGIFTNVVGPLIIWLMKKDQSPFVNDQGREALNFQITVLIGYVASTVLFAVVIGFVLAPIIGVLNLVFGLMGTVAANNGTAYRYPISIRLIK